MAYYGPEKGAYPPSQPQTTVVVSSQPAPGQGPLREWSSGMCGCFEDCGVCALMFFCSPFYECCTVQSEFGESCMTVCCCGPQVTFAALRYRFRDRHNIRGSLFGDLCATMCCYPLVACQLMRENKAVRGQGAPMLGDINRI